MSCRKVLRGALLQLGLTLPLFITDPVIDKCSAISYEKCDRCLQYQMQARQEAL